MREEFLHIWLHDDAWLEELLRGKIRSRDKLSHWPLSYVEKITLESGAGFVYKSQHAASSVEFAFYSKVKAPFLASPIHYERYKNCDIMIFPYIGYAPMGKPDEARLAGIVLSASRMIRDFDMPVFFDLSTVEKFMDVLAGACMAFEGEEERREVAALIAWMREKAPACYEQPIGNVHGDLTGTNILMEDGQVRVILDWQRPVKAPLGLEAALAFRLAEYDAVAQYGDMGILAAVFIFMWYAYAYRNLLPVDYVLRHARKLLAEIVSMIQ